MEIPKLQKPERYTGLYIVDFGDSSSVGFTAEEVAELLDSARYKDCKVYKIHKAYPDGRLELKAVTPELFQLEAGMFFYCDRQDVAEKDFKAIVNIAVKTAPPCRAKVHLARYSDSKFAAAVIYPAEYDEQISSWLLEAKYMTAGPAEGGVEAVNRYYADKPQILKRHQLFGASSFESRTGGELLSAVKMAVQR